MKKLLLTALCIMPMAAFANIAETLSADGSACETDLNVGLGALTLTGTFGSGTATLEYRNLTNDAWISSKAYTAAPSPNPDVVDFGGIPVKVRITLASSTSPSLYCEIRAASKR